MRIFYLFNQLTWMASCTGLHSKPAIWISVNHGISFRHSYNWYHWLASCQLFQFRSSTFHLSTATETAPYPMKRLEAALEENRADKAWEYFCKYKCFHGFPNQIVVKKMISLFSRSLGSHWLLRSYNLVLAVLHKSPALLDYDSLARLGLTLARSQMPVHASTIMRIALDRFKFPTFDILNTMFFHMVKSDVGSCLASNILIEICERALHQKSNARISVQMKLLKQNCTTFNLVLNSCSKFEYLQKAQLIIKLMSQIGVAANSNSILIFAQIYEMLGHRDELMRLKMHVDSVVSMGLSHHYLHFYDSLLSLHFRYNDLDAAMELMLDLYGQSKSSQCSDGSVTLRSIIKKPFLLQIGSGNLTMGYKVMIEPNQLGSDFIVDSRSQSRLVLFSDGKLVPSIEALAKLLSGFVKQGRNSNVSKFLIEAEKEINSTELTLSTFVLAACIELGWLETAHDVLDDLDSTDIFVEASLYKSLLKAYLKGNFIAESKLLLKQMRNKDFWLSISDEEAIYSCLNENCSIKSIETNVDSSEKKSILTWHLIREIREGNLVCPLLYEFNNTIQFFCKANMMDDALRTVKRMQQKNIQPTNQTFIYLINGYSSLKMYRQIIPVWGEIKKRLDGCDLPPDLDLFDCLLMNFLNGGYFERIMEVANYMSSYNVFSDKWKYKEEFLKLYKVLYRNLKAVHAKTDAQTKRLEHVQAFRKWVNIVKT